MIEVYIIVEGKTEELFVKNILAPYLAEKNVFVRASQISKPTQKGGDVKFSRLVKDVSHYLSQRADTFVTTLVDYYGLKEWPGLDEINPNTPIFEISEKLVSLARENEQLKQLKNYRTERFIPFILFHEFEALLFCDEQVISKHLSVDISSVNKITSQFDSPEHINNSRETAPSKRLEKLAQLAQTHFKKTVIGIQIAQDIEIDKMREKCKLFNEWLTHLEKLKPLG